MKIKVSKTTNIQLDWLVLQSQGAFDLHLQSTYGAKKAWVFSERDDEDPERVDRHFLSDYSASTVWSIGGPIIEREKIGLGWVVDHWQANKAHNYNKSFHGSDPQHPLIAAMRCFVASKLGDEVEVPDELA